jgi:hypothetical protein
MGKRKGHAVGALPAAISGGLRAVRPRRSRRVYTDRRGVLHTHLDGMPVTIAVLTEDEAALLPPLPEVYEDDEWTEPYVPEDWTGPSVN